MKKHLILLLAALALAGCKKEMTVWITTAELAAAAQGKNSPVNLPAVLRVELATKNVCEKEGGQVVTLIQNTLGKADNARCEQRGMDSFLLVDTTLPLIHVPKGQPITAFAGTLDQHTSRGIVFLLAHRNGDGETALTPALARGRVESLNNGIERDFEAGGRNGRLKASNFTLSIQIQNPEKSPATLRGRSVYYRDAAMPIAGLATVNAGETAPFQLSEIQTQYLFESGSASDPVIEMAQAAEKPGLIARLLTWIKNLFN